MTHPAQNALAAFKTEMTEFMLTDFCMFGHRKEFLRYNFNGINEKEARTIHVAYRIPKLEDVIDLSGPIQEAFLTKGLQPEQMLKTIEEVAAPMIEAARSEKWCYEATIGKAKVIFEEILPEKRHPVNDAYDALCEVAWREYLDDDDFALFTVNGIGILAGDTVPPSRHFSDTIKLVDAYQAVKANNETRLANSIILQDAGTAFALPPHFIQVGADFFEYAQSNPQFMVNVLEHECAHISAGHTKASYPGNHAVRSIEALSGVRSLLLEMDDKPEQFASLMMRGEKTAQEPMRQLKQLNIALGHMSRSIRLAAQGIESYPEFDELEALTVAAHGDSPESFPRHADRVIRFNLDKSLNQVSSLIEILLEKQQDKSLADGPPDERAKLIKELEAFSKARAGLKDDLITLGFAYCHLSQAQEFSCDFNAVEHAQNPHSVAKVWKQFKLSDYGNGTEKFSFSSHGTYDERIRISNSFAESVLEARSANADKSSQER